MNIQPFNVNEYHSWITSQSSPHNCIIAGKVEGEFNFSRFENAVKIASEQQPMLRYSIAPDIDGFIPCHSKINIREIFDKSTWQAAAEDELATAFLPGEILARISVLKTSSSHYIIICFHHIIGDGISGIDFLKQILRHYNQPNSAIEYDLNEVDIPTPKTITSQINPARVDGRTKIKTFHLEHRFIDALRNQARQNKTSLNAHLSCLVLKIASNIFNTSKFDVLIPVNLRKKDNPNLFHSLGFCTSWVDFLWEKSSENEINSAKNIHSIIKNQLEENTHYNNLLSAAEANCFNNTDKMTLSTNSKPDIAPKVCISNLGVSEDITQSDSDLKLIELHLSVNAQHHHKTNGSFIIVLSELCDRGLFVNVNYCDAHVTDNDMKLFIDTLQEAFQGELCQSI